MNTPRDARYLKTFEQPFSWPSWLDPCVLYVFKSAKLRLEQIAYMKNDALSPVIHVMLWTMLEAASGNLNPCMAEVPDAIKWTLLRKFDFACPQPLLDEPISREGILEPAIAEVAMETKKPDPWSWGLPQGISDEALLDELRQMPKELLQDICMHEHLDLSVISERDFVEHFGGHHHSEESCKT